MADDLGGAGGAGAEALGGGQPAPGGDGGAGGNQPAPGGGNKPAPTGGDMFSGLSEKDRQYAEAKGWPKVGVSGMVEQYRNLETKIGGDPDSLLRLPGENAKPEELDAFWTKLGRPAEATGEKGYQFKAGDNVQVDEKMDGWFRETAHKHNLTEAQAAGLFNEWNELMADQHAQFVADGDKALARLKSEKGANWPAFEAAARQAVEMFVPKDAEGRPDSAILDIMEKQLGTGPLLKMWGEIGARMTNMGAADMTGAGGGDVFTANGAQAEIKKMRAEAANDPKHPLTNKAHPEHADYQRKFQSLYKTAYPGGGEGGGGPFMNT